MREVRAIGSFAFSHTLSNEFTNASENAFAWRSLLTGLGGCFRTAVEREPNLISAMWSARR